MGVEPEEAGVVVRPGERFTIFTTDKKTNPAGCLPQPFHEELKVAVPQRTVRGNRLLGIGQGNETIELVKRRFVNASQRPAARPSYPTADALTAWKRNVRIALT